MLDFTHSWVLGETSHLLILDVDEGEEARREAQPRQQPDGSLSAAHAEPRQPRREAERPL